MSSEETSKNWRSKKSSRSKIYFCTHSAAFTNVGSANIKIGLFTGCIHAPFSDGKLSILLELINFATDLVATHYSGNFRFLKLRSSFFQNCIKQKTFASVSDSLCNPRNTCMGRANLATSTAVSLPSARFAVQNYFAEYLCVFIFYLLGHFFLLQKVVTAFCEWQAKICRLAIMKPTVYCQMA